MKKSILTLITLIFISGCKTLKKWSHDIRQAEIKAHQEKCASFGFTSETLEFGKCMMELDQRSIEAQQRWEERFFSKPPSSTTISCTSYKSFGTTRTKCEERPSE